MRTFCLTGSLNTCVRIVRITGSRARNEQKRLKNNGVIGMKERRGILGGGGVLAYMGFLDLCRETTLCVRI